MALGEAFITIRADTSKFKQDLSNQLKATLADAQKKTDGYTKSQVDAAKLANKAIVDAERAAYKERDAMAKAAANGKLAAEKQYEKEFKALLDEETKAATQAAKAASAAVTAAAREKSAAEKQAATEMEAASRDAGRQMVAISRATAAEQVAAARTASAAVKEQAASVRAAYAEMSVSSTEFAAKSSAQFGAIGSAIRSLIVTPLLAAAAAGAALTVGVGFFGLKMAADLQSAQVGVEGVIAAQEQYNGKLAEGQAAGEKFFNTLKATARLTPFNLQDLAAASQQLIAIGLNGDQTIGVVNTLGNALATSGKVTADRLNNAVLAITQINSLGKVTRDNIRQITSNIPTFNQTEFVRQIALLDAIKARGKDATASTADLTRAQFELENGLVGSTTGIQAIINTMQKIPGASTAMERQMNTLAGVTSNFHDTIQQAFGAAFIPQLPRIQSGLNDVSLALSRFFGQVAPGVADFIVQLGPIIEQSLPSMVRLIQASTDGFSALAGIVLPLLPVLASGLEGVVNALSFMAPLVKIVAEALGAIFNLPGFSTAFGIFAVSLLGAVSAVSIGIKVMKLFEAAMLAARVAAVFLATEAPILGVALEIATGPIGLVVAGIAALAYGFYVAWQRSETFRSIVISVFNTIVTAVGFAVKIFINLMAAYAEAPLRAFDLVLKGVSHLPSWLGGGVASDAEGAVAALIGHIEDWRNAALGAIDDVVSAAKLVPAFADPTGLANADFGYGDNAAANITAELNKQGVFAPVDKGNTNLSGGLTPDKTPDTSKADKAKAKAKAAAEKIKAAMADLKGDFKAIGDQTSKLTAAQIKTNFNALIKDLKDSGHKALAVQAKVIEDQLIADAKKLKTKQDTLAAELAIAQPIKNSITDLGNVSTPTRGIATTFHGITNNLTLAIRNAKDFVAAIKTLQSENLDPVLLQQLVTAGPVNGLDAARALISSGLSGIQTVNAQQAQLTGLGNDLANAVTPEFYEAGKHVGDGLLEGLKSSEKALSDEMDKIADMMIAKFDKKLGIKSPSTVFAKRGDHLAEGLAMGLDRSGGTVAGAMGRISNTVINFGPGSIAVDGGTHRPEQTGNLLGQGIVGVLQQRQTAAALNGTG